MKLTWLFALTLAGIPTVAQAQTRVSEKAGAWEVTGEGGDCGIGLMNQTGLLMIVSPATGGENQGGIMISKMGIDVPDGPGATLEIADTGAFAGAHALVGTRADSVYWLAFPTASTVDTFSDAFRLKVTRDGKTQVDMQVTGFAAARAALKRCVESTR
jgi:hypothetical protein